MLTAEEEVNSIKYSIELDHCYTSRLSPSQSKPADPLPDLSSSEMDESMSTDLNKALLISSNNASVVPSAKQKGTTMSPKLVKQPASGRPRRASNAMQPTSNNQKSAGTNARSNSMQENNIQGKNDIELEEDELFSSSDSSDSEESFSDGDFGPKPFRRGVRARGGRRGLTTRGGSMSASRRRTSSKQMDGDQVRRLDIEMAAVVSAMKNPEKEDKSDKLAKNKKQIKVLNAKKKDDAIAPSTPTGEPPPAPVEINVLQTTNQVKANLINANMCKGDMILTKPGQNRNNQKVIFIPKQIGINSNDIKNVNFKKQVPIPKNKLITSQSPKVPMAKDGKVSTSLSTGKNSTSMPPVVRQIVNSAEIKTEPTQILVTPQKTMQIVRPKPPEDKKEKKKPDVNADSSIKVTNEALKSVESKTPIGKYNLKNVTLFDTFFL